MCVDIAKSFLGAYSWQLESDGDGYSRVDHLCQVLTATLRASGNGESIYHVVSNQVGERFPFHERRGDAFHLIRSDPAGVTALVTRPYRVSVQLSNERIAGLHITSHSDSTITCGTTAPASSSKLRMMGGGNFKPRRSHFARIFS